MVGVPKLPRAAAAAAAAAENISRVGIDLGEPGPDPEAEVELHARFAIGKE